MLKAKAEGFKSDIEMDEAIALFHEVLTPKEISVTKITIQGESFKNVIIESNLNIEDKAKQVFGKYFKQ